MVTERVGRIRDSASVLYSVATDLWEAQLFFCISFSVILAFERFVFFQVVSVFLFSSIGLTLRFFGL